MSADTGNRGFEGLDVRVDDFSPVKGIEHFFLTSFRESLLRGLGASHWRDATAYNRFIMCSEISMRLVQYKYDIPDIRFKVLEKHQRTFVQSTSKGPLYVLALDSLYCPGSLMYIFTVDNFTVLYTGYFRYTPEISRNPLLLEANINRVYLDDTYLHEKRQFPLFSQVLSSMKRLAISKARKKLYIACPPVGYEEILLSLAKLLHTKIVLNKVRYRMAEIALGYGNPEMDTFFTLESSKGSIEVTTMKELNAFFIAKESRVSSCYGIVPSAENYYSNYDRNLSEKNQVFMFPYATHSCYHELMDFVKLLKVSEIVSLRNFGTEKIKKYFGPQFCPKLPVFAPEKKEDIVFEGSCQFALNVLQSLAETDENETKRKVKKQKILERSELDFIEVPTTVLETPNFNLLPTSIELVHAIAGPKEPAAKVLPQPLEDPTVKRSPSGIRMTKEEKAILMQVASMDECFGMQGDRRVRSWSTISRIVHERIKNELGSGIVLSLTQEQLRNRFRQCQKSIQSKDQSFT